MIPGFGRTGFGRHQIYPDLWVITFYHIFNIPHYPTFPHKSTINGPFSMDSMQVIKLQGGAPYLAKSDYNSNFTMIYDRYSISIVTNWFINQRSHHWGAPPCTSNKHLWGPCSHVKRVQRWDTRIGSIHPRFEKSATNHLQKNPLVLVKLPIKSG